MCFTGARDADESSRHIFYMIIEITLAGTGLVEQI